MNCSELNSSGCLKELHDVMLTMLVDIDAVCRKYGLRYYLAYGTLLGAVRHRGFIPWDDDADIVMPRKDYERFLSIAAQSLGEKYFVQYHKTEPWYRHPFAKIRRNGTACVIQNHRHIPMHQGIFVDIFPLENVPSFNWTRKIIWGIANFTDRLCALNIAKLPPKYRWLFPLKWLLSFGVKPSKLACIGDALICIIQARKSDRVMCAYVPGGNSKKNEFPSAWFGDGQDADFAGRTLRVPENAEAVLLQIYGDFMMLPPVDKRCPVHAKNPAQISATKDYRSFIPELYGDNA